MKTITQQKGLKDQIVLLRLDLNVPVQAGKVIDATRIDEALTTINYLRAQEAKIIIIAHFGRPKKPDAKYSLQVVYDYLQEEHPEISWKFFTNKLTETLIPEIKAAARTNIILLENLRFYPEETVCEPKFSRLLAALADLYVNDALSVSHRKHASIVGVTEFLPAFAGLNLARDQQLLTGLLQSTKPSLVIIGGAKISTKFKLIENMLAKYDFVYIAGAMANNFFAAQGYQLGQSYYEPEYVHLAAQLLEQVRQKKFKGKLLLPVDCNCLCNEEIKVLQPHELTENSMILDLGPQSVQDIYQYLAKVEQIIWNGPLGKIEQPPFHQASSAVAQQIAQLTQQQKLRSIAGGGDVLAAIKQAVPLTSFSHIFTAGGAFLQIFEGAPLVGLTCLGA